MPPSEPKPTTPAPQAPRPAAPAPAKPATPRPRQHLRPRRSRPARCPASPPCSRRRRPHRRTAGQDRRQEHPVDSRRPGPGQPRPGRGACQAGAGRAQAVPGIPRPAGRPKPGEQLYGQRDEVTDRHDERWAEAAARGCARAPSPHRAPCNRPSVKASAPASPRFRHARSPPCRSTTKRTMNRCRASASPPTGKTPRKPAAARACPLRTMKTRTSMPQSPRRPATLRATSPACAAATCWTSTTSRCNSTGSSRRSPGAAGSAGAC